MGWRVIEWLMENVFPWIAMAFVAGIFCVFGMAIYVGVVAGESPEFCLVKSEWRCSKWHEVSTTTYVKVGEVLVPMTSRWNECDAYEKDVRP